MTILVDKNGKEEQINYYELEAKFKSIINNLDNKKNFDEFIEKYQYFNPYFDYALLELGYYIKNPLGLENSIIFGLDKEKILYIKNIDFNDIPKDFDFNERKEFAKKYNNKYPISKCDNETLNIRNVDYEFSKLSNGLIDRFNNFIEIPKQNGTHNDLALLIVNQMLIQNKYAYQDYIQIDGVNKELSFLEKKFGFIRFGIMGSVIVTYYGSKISYRQKDYLSYLKANNYLSITQEHDFDKYQQSEYQYIKK